MFLFLCVTRFVKDYTQTITHQTIFVHSIMDVFLKVSQFQRSKSSDNLSPKSKSTSPFASRAKTDSDSDGREIWTKTFNRYKDIEQIAGEGNKVYKCIQLQSGRSMILKRMPCANEEELNLVLMEIICCRSVSHHHIVRYEDVYLEDNGKNLVLCVTMELYEDLHQLIRERIEQNINFSEAELLYLMHQISSGLVAMHQRNLIHRDLQPKNILVNRSNAAIQFQITDFALTSRVANLSESDNYARWYTAPEVYSQMYSFAVDVYSLGVTMIEMALLEPLSYNIGLLEKQEGSQLVMCSLYGKLFASNPEKPYSKKFINLILSCIDVEFRKRPSAALIMSKSASLFAKTNIPASDLFPETEYFKDVEPVESLVDCSVLTNSDGESDSNGSSGGIEKPLTNTISSMIHRFKVYTDLDTTSVSRSSLALDSLTNRKVNLRTIPRGYDPDQILGELLILSNLNHPNIVSIEEAFFSMDKNMQKYFNFVTEYYQQGSLTQALDLRNANQQYYSELELIVIFHQIACALQYLHQLGVVHRDIQPSSIMINHTDDILDIKLSNFGFSVYYSDRQDSSNHFAKSSWLGSMDAHIPELVYSGFKPAYLTYAADIFSLGLLIFDASCHSKFNYDGNEARLINKMKMMRSSGLSDPLFQLIMDCVKIDPKERPTAKNLVHQLQELQHKYAPLPKLKQNHEVSIMIDQ
jgi:serine/threonine protein kinase